MPHDASALLFPGQGSQTDTMLDGLASLDPFQRRYALMTDVLGQDLLEELHAGRTSIHANVTGSLLIILASAVSLDLLKHQQAIGGPIMGLAGYSVGQWVALYAASAITFEQLVRIVHRRASLMDDCAAANPGGMIAVIGVGEDLLHRFCADMRKRGDFAAIANYNALGQYSISVEKGAMTAAMEELQTLKPMKTIELQAAGPWHSELMRPASDEFGRFLEAEEFRAPEVPTIDNVTGDFLPMNTASWRKTLAEHISRPVRWSQGVEALIARGAVRCIETGYGNMLSKFGFFINRDVQHITARSLTG